MAEYESKSRSLQQRRRRLEHEEPNPKLVLAVLYRDRVSDSMLQTPLPIRKV